MKTLNFPSTVKNPNSQKADERTTAVGTSGSVCAVAGVGRGGGGVLAGWAHGVDSLPPPLTSQHHFCLFVAALLQLLLCSISIPHFGATPTSAVIGWSLFHVTTSRLDVEQV